MEEKFDGGMRLILSRLILLLLFEIGKWDEKDGRFESFTKRVRNLQGYKFLSQGRVIAFTCSFDWAGDCYVLFFSKLFLWVNVV